VERESMEFDVVIVGAGPAGLSTACKLMQLANEKDQELMVCVVEKGSEVGAHILSGAVFEPRSLNELFPDWKEKGAPLNTPVTEDHIYLLNDETSAKKLPNGITPKTMHNDGNYIVSMGNVCRWLAEQAEQLGVEVFPGFAASEVIYNEDGSVEESKMTYSRPNVFKMDAEDGVLADLANAQKKVRLRIAVSRNNQNTTFEWFDFDFAGFKPTL